MTQTFKLDVAQKSVGPGLHSYETVDRANGRRIDMQKNKTCKNCEIEIHLGYGDR